MQTYALVKIGEQRKTPRVWLEGARLAVSGFDVATRYNIEVDREARRLTLRVAPDGQRLVSRKERAGKALPIIDICNGGLLAMFAGLDQLRVIFEDGAVHILPLASEARKQVRAERLREKIRTGQPLTVGSISTGVGALSLALHEGMQAEGVKTRLGFACDIEPVYIEQCAERNPAWCPETVMIAAPMQELAFDRAALSRLPALDVLEAGIPCTGHSNAGRAKKGLAMGEDDPNVGHLVAAFVAMIPVLNPSLVVVENVPAYMSSASFAILRNQLTEWGYVVHADVLRGADFGSLEHRDRMALVAVTEGVDFDFSMLAKVPESRRLGEILDDVPADSPRWSDMAGLKAKEARDREAGKGFAMQIFDATSQHIGTLTRGYAKVRSTDPKIRHPERPELLRQLSAAEHARIKDIPLALIEGMSETRAHEGLGQSIVMRPFRALGRALAAALLRMATTQEPEAEAFALC